MYIQRMSLFRDPFFVLSSFITDICIRVWFNIKAFFTFQALATLNKRLDILSNYPFI
jgi:hypothetical protein